MVKDDKGQQKMKEINFPKNELVSLKSRIRANLPVYTTRISDEVGKYSVGNIVRTNIDSLVLIIREIIRIDNLSEHPFLDELTTEQKKLIILHNKLDDL